MPDIVDSSNFVGPRVYFDKSEATLLCGRQQSEQLIIQKGDFLERAVILGTGVYFVLNIQYPRSFGQFCGVVQEICFGREFVEVCTEEVRELLDKIKC